MAKTGALHELDQIRRDAGARAQETLPGEFHVFPKDGLADLDDVFGAGVEDRIDEKGLLGAELGEPLHLSGHVGAGAVAAGAFDRAAGSDPNSRKIQYGLYKLRTQIPAKTALAMLLDPANQVKNQFQIREGLRLSEVLTSLAASTKVPERDLEVALKDRKQFDLPSWNLICCWVCGMRKAACFMVMRRHSRTTPSPTG